MTNDTTSSTDLARLQHDLIQAVASLRCVHEIILNNEGVAGVPKHARVLLEGVLNGLEGYADGDKLSVQ